jgi:hypothetical protein
MVPTHQSGRNEQGLKVTQLDIKRSKIFFSSEEKIVTGA